MRIDVHAHYTAPEFYDFASDILGQEIGIRVVDGREVLKRPGQPDREFRTGELSKEHELEGRLEDMDRKNIAVQVLSPGGTFNFREVLIAFQPFPTGAPPFPPLAPGVPFSAPTLLLGGAPPPFGPVLLSPTGTTVTVIIPPGFTGTSVLLQGVIITWLPPTALNGIYATSDAHEIRIL